jgi:hypothetical protein
MDLLVRHQLSESRDGPRTHTGEGIRGIFTSRYVFAAAAFATLGGTLFGYEYVGLCKIITWLFGYR